MRAQCRIVAALIGAGLAVSLALHLLEPRLVLTWGFAHLDRRPLLRVAGVALVLLLPAATAVLWRQPWTDARPRRVPWWAWIAGAAAAAVVLAVIGNTFPAPAVSEDAEFFRMSVETPWFRIPRWYLTVTAFGQLVRGLRPVVSIPTLIRCGNALLVATALAALAGCARRLGRTRGEVGAITALAWTAFGVLQLGIGYVDVYPAALAVAALYLWAALSALDGMAHPAWALGLAALGPFFYEGLALLGPSVLVLIAILVRRPGGGRRVAVGLLVATLLAGLATIPGWERPFAWLAFVRQVAGASNVDKGLSPTSTLLPPEYLWSGIHAREIVQTLLLVDGVGVLLLLVAGSAVALRGEIDLAMVLVGSLVVPYLAYVVAFDPIYGAFADWDLFSWGAAATSLLGAYTFVVWGRTCRRTFAVLLGLALATAGVHLLARLNALDVALDHHMHESPMHILPKPAPPPRRR